MARISEQQTTSTSIYPSRELALEFQEAIEHRSSPIDEVIKKLKEGTILWKVRSFNNWYRRKYFLDVQAGKITYDPSHKFWRQPTTEISFEEIVDVRLGWKTDTFNKIGHKVEKRLNKQPDSKPIVEEDLCFSIIYGKSKQSLDLVAPSAEIAKQWVRTLSHFLTVVEGLRQEQRFERWLKQKFQEADEDKNASLNFSECSKLLKKLNVKMSNSVAFAKFEESNTNKNTRDSEQVLDEIEFVDFFLKLMTRTEIQELYNKYAESKKDMNSIQLCQFLQKEQHLLTITPQECLTLIEAFEQSSMRQIGKMSLMGFTQMLLSEEFELFNTHHRVVFQDMSQPLAHYYIASSHNTYLTGHQISGESSVEGYIDALKRGCRCVELDCWDGPDNEPIVYHGYTLTTKINFKDILMDAIKPYAFHSSEYPVILSLENHCSPEQQAVLAERLVDILGDLIYTDPVDPDLENLPSPEFLKHKILIKAKKSSSDADSSDSSDDGEDSSKRSPSGIELSNLVNLIQAVHFKNFQSAKTKGKYYEMSSFSEAKAQKYIEEAGQEFVEFNKKHLSRIYPGAKRTDSSNFKPTPFWNVGCQMVALNYQKCKKPVFLNESKFRQNGNCGYLLKPKYLRDPLFHYDPSNTATFKETRLKLKIISGQYIPKPENDDHGEVVDPYVKVKIIGHPDDNKKLKTDAVHNNGFNPRWNYEMNFDLKLPELAMVHFIVKDKKNSGKDETLGTYALPFESISQGYRHIYLMDYERNFVSPATLFVHVTITNF